MANLNSKLGGNVGRARRTPGQLWQVPTFFLGLLAFIGVAVSAPWRPTPQAREFDELVATLRRGLDRNDAPDSLLAPAETLALRLDRFPAHAADAHYLIGSVYYRQALQKTPALAKEIWPRVVDHLEHALAGGVADTDRAALQFRLGFAMYQRGKNVPRALELMMLGVEKGSEQPLAAYQLLVKAHLQQKPPGHDGAIAAVRRILDLTPESDTEALAVARLQHGELLADKGSRGEALKELERIGPKASRAVRVKARLLQARCADEDGQWAKAIPIWQELLRDATNVEGGRARVLYSLGRCSQQLEPADHDQAIRAWSEASALGGVYGQAAGLRLGDLRLAKGSADQALADWKVALDKVNGPDDFRNPLIDKETVRDWFEKAIHQFNNLHEPEHTQAVAELFRKIAPRGVAEKHVAEAAEAVAKQMDDQLKTGDVKTTAVAVRDQYRRAGEAHAQAAESRPDAEKPQSLWRSAQCYIASEDASQAQQMLHQFVKLEKDETRLAEGWCTLGDLYRADKKKEFARDAYLKCIEYPSTPFAYQARYFLAGEEIERKNYDQARKILEQNLATSALLDIDRSWLEKSHYKMASLLMDMEQNVALAEAMLTEPVARASKQTERMQILAETKVRLNEYVSVFPEGPQVLQAKLNLGECFRKMAKIELLREIDLQNQLKPGTPEDLIQRKKDEIRNQHDVRVKTLRDSFTAYQQLADTLESASRKKPLTGHEAVLLRRALLGVGECNLDDERYLEALRIFKDVQINHRCTLEACYASQFIFYVFQSMEHQNLSKQQVDLARESAKESLRMLVEDLQALPKADDAFRKHWLTWAGERQRLLVAPPKIESGPKFQ